MPDPVKDHTADYAHLRSLLDQVVGESLWSAITPSAGEYVAALDLGEQCRRSMRLANPRLSFLQRTYEGSFNFLIECPWRLEGPDGVITSYLSLITPKTDSEGHLRRPTKAHVAGGGSDVDLPDSDSPPLDALVDSVVEAVTLTPGTWDLRIEVSGGLALQCFCAEVGHEQIRNNWAFWSPTGLITVGPKSVLIEQTRSQAEAAFRRLVWVPPPDDALDPE